MMFQYTYELADGTEVQVYADDEQAASKLVADMFEGGETAKFVDVAERSKV